MRPAAERTRVIGREEELTRLRDFLGAASHRRALVLTAEPGMGKTTLWEAGIEAARERQRVLVARPSVADTPASFAGLIDLLDEVDFGALESLPGPQRRALAVALLRADPLPVPPEPHAIRVGFLHALRTLAVDEPVLVAIDDLQWLDPASADALVFAARRIEGDDIRFLAAKRPAVSTALEPALEGLGLERLEVGPLSLGGIRGLLSERLGLVLPRHVLRRVMESTEGNPLFALELGRTLAERGLPALGEDLPIPDAVDDLLGTRVDQLEPPLRKLLLATALSGDLGPTELAAIENPRALDDAVEAGLLVLDRDRVRPSHPLLAAAAVERAGERERRLLHRELARILPDDQLRARHLALATTDPDPELASTVAAAASRATARGARHEAVVLAEHALRLTPPNSAEQSERLLALAEHLKAAGEAQRVTDLLTPELEALPRGARVHARLLLCEGGAIGRNEDYERHLELAVAESEDDDPLRAVVLSTKASHTAVARVERIAEAEGWALEALPSARRSGPEVERQVLASLSWSRVLRGRSIDDLCERYRDVSDAAYSISDAPEAQAA